MPPEISPNRLITESSPYLRQHALNPVQWYAWGAEALDLAKAEDKPIHLSIGYSACHWCHVMAHECFENQDIAALMNQYFINVKVDREERPDLDDLYQKAAQVFLGRGGGWPLTMFLTPNQEPFYGGTYFPPVPRHNLPGFPQVLSGVIEAYRQHGGEVQKNVERVKAGLARVSFHSPVEDPLSEGVLDDGVKDVELFFDPAHGGFGEGPKFPTVPPLQLLLRQAARTNHPTHREHVLLQLRHMAAGGIYDHLGGGFHRYSVDGQWLVPHFEKMLYDNAQLVRIYLDGWRLTKEFRFRQVVEETLEYLRREMMHSDGAFFSAQDADSEGVEGKYFLWDASEIRSVLGSGLGEQFMHAYGVTSDGNFEGQNVLNRLASVEWPQEGHVRVDRELQPARKKLLAVRDRRARPERDENIITSWNALVASALFDAYQALGTSWYLASAEQTLTFLVDYAVRGSQVFRMVTDGKGRIAGYLDDYAYLAAALLDAFETTGHFSYLEQARVVVDSMLAQFWDEPTGGFFFTGAHHEPLIHRMKSGFDGSIPSGNAVAVQTLLRLAALTGVQSYEERAVRTLRVFHHSMGRNAYGSCAMLCALESYLSKLREIVIVGSLGNPATEGLLATVHQRYVPNKVVLLLDESRRGKGFDLLLAAGKVSMSGRPTAYVCRQFVCSPAVTESAQLELLL